MSACPICGDANEKRALAKVNLVYQSEFSLVECPQCGVMFFDPLPSTEQLATFYSATYYDFDKWKEEGKGMAFAHRLRRWKRTGKLLDVGCATGFFLNGIRNNSEWEVYGTDFGESAVRFARDKLGLDVRHGDIADVGFPDAFFDYVHVNNVLEHVRNPVSMLHECKRVLKPDGIFFLSVPNGFNDTLDLIDFYKTENKPARSKSGHIFFFPARTLLGLFEQIGFDVKKKRTYSIKRGLRSIGYFPRKRDWKTDYYPREVPEIQTATDVRIPHSRKRHSDFYYQYRFMQGNLQMIPGLHKFGLDFLFLMTPKP